MSGSEIAAAAPLARPAGKQGRGFLGRAEVRDVLAWVRLLVDPQDASAVVRALARPPIDLRQVDLARVIQVARRRKLDLVVGLSAATESPQVPPEARERIQRFVELHRSAAAELDAVAPDVFLSHLIDRLEVPGRSLLGPEEAAARRESLQGLRQLATDFVRANPNASTRELARHLAVVAPQALAEDRATRTPPWLDQRPSEQLPAARAGGEDRPVSPAPGAAAERSATGGEDGPQQDTRELVPDPVGEALQVLRAEVLDGVTRIGGRLGELRLDTDLDISHGVVGYLELLKLAALLQRPAGESLKDALEDINLRLLAATTPLEREIFQTSPLDDALLAAESGEHGGARAPTRREEHSLGPFLPRKGVGLALSASDIETYRGCPLRYKFARVLRIPSEQTIHQRFGIVVHQVLERYHSEDATTLARMLELLDTGWRRAGFGDGERELALREKAGAALTRYHARLEAESSKPVWFERQFSFRLGPHHLRGRVDRVDRLVDGAEQRYELIDYKTSRPKTALALRDDVQLSLYALAAREAWQLESSCQAYYYVLDDLKVPVPRSERDAESVRDVVLEVGEGILAQAFEPTPSPAACSICDYRIVCPAAEG
ncbi:MAG TPA: PD-(D/E)XK nuclease family protein [Solirubrobacteraceae bacterium]|nr:PD-(D/E)XK nuclease family protein [Solirubrobacteraceae bacterium]